MAGEPLGIRWLQDRQHCSGVDQEEVAEGVQATTGQKVSVVALAVAPAVAPACREPVVAEAEVATCYRWGTRQMVTVQCHGRTHTFGLPQCWLGADNSIVEVEKI